jgi:SAM-dependent methyltransferase
MNIHNLFTTNNPLWFKNRFDTSFYHQLYAHRNEAEAADFIEQLLAELQPTQNSSMLDLGCGAGRHAKHLASKGFVVTGIDLSFSSIHKAIKLQTPNLQFYRRDMRTPFGHGLFDYVFNFFTSFGYFTDVKENNLVLQNIFNALKPGGSVVIDYLNVPVAEKKIVPVENKDIDGVRYAITRWHDENFFFKKIRVEDVIAGQPYEYIEQVSKFSLSHFEKMLFDHGFRIKNIFGNYQLNPYNAEQSERLIVMAEKAS